MDRPSYEVNVAEFRYEPVGHCIYCGDSSSFLTLEHIIPLNLVGHLKLPKASCSVCQKVTHAFETEFAKATRGFRYRLGIKARKPKKRVHVHTVTINDGHRKREIQIPTEDFPKLLSIPELVLPRILTGASDNDLGRIWNGVDLRDMRAFADRYGGQEATFAKYDVATFLRLVAKVAHAYAYAAIPRSELSSYNLLLGDFIRTGEGDPLYLIGGGRQQLDKVKDLHQIELLTLERSTDELLVCRLRLFAALGAPEHHVVVGIREKREA
ncbi:hypothetical protein [Vitreimonas flagellata]|uniref:hypothetical protein n=1 Tax=Vitreimonas flagellata TaxID=2560861 RepID=UPI00107564A9|nr:hypothetical protein [Vitreimonas flagellata]